MESLLFNVQIATAAAADLKAVTHGKIQAVLLGQDR
jgi:hypothetical protein